MIEFILILSLKFYFDILVISNIKMKFSMSKIYNFYSLVFITEPTYSNQPLNFFTLTYFHCS